MNKSTLEAVSSGCPLQPHMLDWFLNFRGSKSLRLLARFSDLIPKEIAKMPLVSMRQLLDEAAKGGYGVGAFNVNNMEQIQAIMEAARETKSPVIVQASRGARGYSQDRFLYHLMLAATELYPEIPTVCTWTTATASRPASGHRHGLHQRHDGRLADAGRQDALQLRIQREGDARSGGDGACQGRHRGRRNRLPGRHRRRPWRRSRRPEPPHRSGAGGRIREADRSGRLGHRHRHQPRRIQVQPEAHRRNAEDGAA